MASSMQIDPFSPFWSNQPLKAFFRSVMAWEKEQMSGISVAQEVEGVYHYKSESDHKGVLLEGSASDFSLASVEEACPSFQGFGLVIVNLEKVRRDFPQHTNSRHGTVQLAVKSKQNF